MLARKATREIDPDAQEKRRPVAIGFVCGHRLRRARRGDRERRSSSRTDVDRGGAAKGANSREVDFEDDNPGDGEDRSFA
jgi:hypothetical protein